MSIFGGDSSKWLIIKRLPGWAIIPPHSQGEYYEYPTGAKAHERFARGKMTA